MSLRRRMSQRILVADEDPQIRRLVTSMVINEGYEAVIAADGRETYRILHKDANFSAAIFDMMMPHLKGLDIIRYMRTEKRLMRIPVMLITSERSLNVMADSFAAGATVFLQKPFRIDLLQTTLQMLSSTARSMSVPV